MLYRSSSGEAALSVAIRLHPTSYILLTYPPPMLTIRLTRVGKKKQPQYRFIVSEKARDPWGKALEILGTYEPLRNPVILLVDKERVAYWISKGAQCSDTVWNLFIDQGMVKGEKRKHGGISIRHKEKLAKKQPAA